MSGEKEWQRIAPRREQRRTPHRAPQPARAEGSRPVRLARGGVTTRGLWALRSRAGNALLQRLASDGEFVAPERVERAIESQRGGGQPLAHGVRGPMEGALGADLSSVRVHDDAQAAALNQDLSARAFTHGGDIFFGAGEYAPETGAGQRLLAHELAHVMQQRDGAQLTVGAANDPAEQEADAVAQAAVQRLQGVARQPEEEEEEVQPLRRQEGLGKEDELQELRRQEMPEEEEEAQALRRQEGPEEEELALPRR
jgi:hypothetical protein